MFKSKQKTLLTFRAVSAFIALLAAIGLVLSFIDDPENIARINFGIAVVLYAIVSYIILEQEIQLARFKTKVSAEIGNLLRMFEKLEEETLFNIQTVSNVYENTTELLNEILKELSGNIHIKESLMDEVEKDLKPVKEFFEKYKLRDVVILAKKEIEEYKAEIKKLTEEGRHDKVESLSQKVHRNMNLISVIHNPMLGLLISKYETTYDPTHFCFRFENFKNSGKPALFYPKSGKTNFKGAWHEGASFVLRDARD